MITVPKFTHVTPQNACYNVNRKYPVRQNQGTMIIEKNYYIDIPIGTILQIKNTNICAIYCGHDICHLNSINHIDHSNSVNIWKFDMENGDIYTQLNDNNNIYVIDEQICVEIINNSDLILTSNAFIYIINLGLVKTTQDITFVTNCIPANINNINNINYEIFEEPIEPYVYLPMYTKVSLAGPVNNIRQNQGYITLLEDYNILFNDIYICRLPLDPSINISFIGKNMENTNNQNQSLIFTLNKNSKVTNNLYIPSGTYRTKNDCNIILHTNTTIVITTGNYISLNNIGIVKLFQNLEVLV